MDVAYGARGNVDPGAVLASIAAEAVSALLRVIVGVHAKMDTPLSPARVVALWGDGRRTLELTVALDLSRIPLGLVVTPLVTPAGAMTAGVGVLGGR